MHTPMIYVIVFEVLRKFLQTSPPPNIVNSLGSGPASNTWAFFPVSTELLYNCPKAKLVIKIFIAVISIPSPKPKIPLGNIIASTISPIIKKTPNITNIVRLIFPTTDTKMRLLSQSEFNYSIIHLAK